LNRGQVYREMLRVVRGRAEVKKLARADGTLIEPAAVAAALGEEI